MLPTGHGRWSELWDTATNEIIADHDARIECLNEDGNMLVLKSRHSDRNVSVADTNFNIVTLSVPTKKMVNRFDTWENTHTIWKWLAFESLRRWWLLQGNSQTMEKSHMDSRGMIHANICLRMRTKSWITRVGTQVGLVCVSWLVMAKKAMMPLIYFALMTGVLIKNQPGLIFAKKLR